jgi:hypothetical protein
MKKTYDISVTQGIPKKITVEYKEYDESPKDLSGYLGVGTVKKRASDCEEIGQLIVTVVSATEGRVEIEIPLSLFLEEKIKGSNPEEKDNFVYSALLYKPEDINTTIELISGLIKVSPAITKIPVGV